MSKRVLPVLIGGIFIVSAVSAQTVIPGGNVSGLWEAAGSPYLIEGDITLPYGDTLTIEPGVDVTFQGHYKFIVNGWLLAEGTESDSILFTAADTVAGWHGIRFIDSADSSHLSYCIVQDGRATGSGTDNSGGGIFCTSSRPTISHCTISDNSAEYGGGIACWEAANFILENCTLSHNRADSSGGGIRFWNSSPSVENCTFDGNYANVWGGGMSLIHDSNPIISTCNFSRNSADGGAGGIGCYENCHPTLDHCTISNNTTNATGGGMGIGTGSNPTLIECTISENTAGEDGGGISCFGNSNPTISHCTVSDNSAEDDGGGMCITHNCSDIIVSYCTISGNSADDDGGGIFCDDHSGATIDSCTISRNSALGDCGGGIYSNSSDLVISHCTISRSLAYDYGGGVYCYDSYATIENCTISMNSALDDCGGGIYSYDSEATIENCTIRENFCYYGGSGIHAYESNATIYNCTVSENLSYYGSGGIHACESNATIYNCAISGNSGDVGGGICCDWGASLSILNCIINGNSAHYGGGGITCYDSEATIENCTIRENLAGDRGGGITCYYDSDATIQNCTISENLSNSRGGGISCYYNSDATIQKCTVSGNLAASFGSGIDIENCSPSIVNTIVEGNTGGEGGIYFEDCPSVSVSYGDCYDNQNGNYAGAVPIGLGELATLNANGDSCDVFYNICLDPLFVYPDQNDFRLQWGSPCIDAGDPNSPLDPDGTRADMGAFYYDQSVPVRVLLTPHERSIVIPAEGGRFDYTLWLTNIDPSAPQIEAWIDVTSPDGMVVGPLLGPVSTSLDSGITISRERTQNVPAGAPEGIYTYNAYAVAGPDTSFDTFPFFKLEPNGPGGSVNWGNTGESPDEMGEAGLAPTLTPETFSLSQNYPNPFNPLTTIRFTLAKASEVNLTIYNVFGQEIVTLVDGYRKAGVHEVTWDGSEMASGVYIYQLRTGGSIVSGKMVLLK